MIFERPEWIALLPVLALAGWMWRGLALHRPLRAGVLLVTVLLLTVVADPDQIQMAVQMGAGGYLQKGVDGYELAATVRTVFKGEFFACPDIAAGPVSRLN